MKILFVSAEVAPYAKSGGLADVAGSLPKALASKGHDVRIVMPRYKEISQSMKHVVDFPIEINSIKRTCIVRETYLSFQTSEDEKALPVYFIDSYHYFDRSGMYCHYDDADRFAFFSRAVLKMLHKINFQPDVIHLNDWQTGPIAFLLNEKYKDKCFYKNISTVFTVHNAQYQGVYPRSILSNLQISDKYFTPDKLEFYGNFNFMKAGIVYSDIVNTVSETYAKEILTEEYGEGLQGVFQSRENDLYGIVNGIDNITFNPKFDNLIFKNYNFDSIQIKKENKVALQKKVGLPCTNAPVIGLIHRLVGQKGLDLVDEVTKELLGMDIQLIVLGLGDPYYEEMFKDIQLRYPQKAVAFIEFNEELAHKIYAGADMFLMPSAFEPCGLGQLISLNYGTIPIVRETGGLVDTIQNFEVETKKGNGFTFKEYSSEDFLEAVKRAVNIYYEMPSDWDGLVNSAMNYDFSWDKQADKYIDLYKKAMAK